MSFTNHAEISKVLKNFEESGEIADNSISINKEASLVSFVYPEGILGGISYGEYNGDMNGISGSPHYAEFTVDEFMVKASKLFRDDSIYLSIDFVDGDPGDQYMLCIHDYDDPEAMEECAQFLFS